MYDLIIIGGGPAGITAAVYAARKNMDFLMITKDIGGQAAWSGDIENYTGYQFISGPELASKFAEHMKQFSFPLKDSESVTKIERSGKSFRVITEKGSYEARALIIASGKKPRLLNVPGEVEYKNKGVTYCATCDGPVFAGKDVAIIGGGNSALDAALQMLKIATKVYLINIGPALRGDKIMLEKLKSASNIEIMNDTKTLSISGDRFVTSIKVAVGGKERDIPVSGVFIEAGLTPNSEMIDIVEKNKEGEIEVDCSSATTVEGIFAAGDVTNVPDKQIIIAAGEGAKACLSAFRYLSTHRFEV